MRTLSDVQQAIDTLIKDEWNSNYWAPLSSLARLTEEVGELAREINHAYGEKPKKAARVRTASPPRWAISFLSWHRSPTLSALIWTRPLRMSWQNTSNATHSAGNRFFR